jgi:long-chain acyl-CoA synthetase
MEDLKELKGGRKFSPQFAEIRLRFCPYIKDALVVGGEDKDYVTAIINIDLDNVGRWAEAKRIPYTTFTDLSQKPEVIELIKKDIQRINKFLPEWSRIKKFVNLHKEFDADEAELTRTRKLRRAFVESRYSDLIRALYGQEEQYHVEASVTYRDGRKGVVRTSIQINSVEEA